MVLRARALRRDMSLPEGLLWRELRQRPGGFKFRRQHPIGNLVVDFYCPSARLVVEVDGLAHDMGAQPKRDPARDAWLNAQGFRVLRITAPDVLRDVGPVVALLVLACGS
jgi:very-short-patch-repair endonuclease